MSAPPATASWISANASATVGEMTLVVSAQEEPLKPAAAARATVADARLAFAVAGVGLIRAAAAVARARGVGAGRRAQTAAAERV